MVKKFMKEEHPDVKHHFDVWHVSKGVTKNLETCAKKKDGEPTRQWTKSIGNHMYWSAISAGNDGEEKLAKWTSLSNHICNIHEGHSDKFPRCLHSPCDDKEWLIKGSRQHKMVISVVESPYLLRDVAKLSPFHQTYSLEVFHSVVNHFASKSTHFFYSSMQARLYLTALHYNENGKKERAYTKEGQEKWQISYPKSKKGAEAVVKSCKVNTTYG
ncbi:uncharacterized protein LOC132552497 [Ylistrum balloti]|uniref:uncharacterized protein LOC132552497 n=1 Tax=Ylistrum balloti TaxID=509963 RepID=UPI00290589AA|nr:uncharacterized protein LOC132552497 [Ylistrum balloti]